MRCSRYHAISRSLFRALKKTPPMPVTRSSTNPPSFEGHDEPHGDALGGLGAHGTRAVAADQPLHALQLGIGDPGDVAIGDLECLAIDHAIADGPPVEPVMRVDPRQ